MQINTERNAVSATVLSQRNLLGCAIRVQIVFIRNAFSAVEPSPKKLPASARVARASIESNCPLVAPVLELIVVRVVLAFLQPFRLVVVQ